MRSPSLAPFHEEPVHLVLCDFGRLGLAYQETDPVMTECMVVESMLAGEYDRPIQVVAFSISEGWARDVSEDVAHDVLEQARKERRLIPAGTRKFLERLLDEEVEPELLAGAG
jgi:hypothetical protein